jgi:hypothetical protein
MFDSDRLYSEHAAHVRFDITGSTSALSLLLKYDIERGKWYDVEVALEHTFDCVRAFVAYRKFPGTISAGIKLRADRLFEALRKRDQSRRRPDSGNSGNR